VSGKQNHSGKTIATQQECQEMYGRAMATGKIIEDGDCLIWTGSLSKSSGHPKYCNQPLRRIAHQAKHGMLKKGEYTTVTCGNPKCLEHTAKVTKSEITKKQNADPRVKASKRAKNAAWSRANKAKLTLELAEEIRNSDETGPEIAARLNVSRSLASKVRTNQAWAAVNATPFSGLFRGAI
jgi:hypothetical protein